MITVINEPDQEDSVVVNKRDLWNADVTIAKVILPILKKFKLSHAGYPSYMTPEEFDEKLQQVIDAIEIVLSDDYYGAEGLQVTGAMKVFGEIFTHLWD